MKYFIFILAVFLIFFNLGSTTLVNWDEAWFAAVARDGMWNGQPWFYEPPLLTWVLGIIIKLGGNSEFILRSFNGFCGLGVIVMTYLLAKKMSNERGGIIASLILISNIEFLFRARQINTDVPLTLFLLLSIYWAHGKAWVRSSVSLGLAFLTKRASPVLALPALYLLRLKKKRGDNNARIKIILAFLIVVLPWLVFSYFKWGNLFIKRFFIGFTINKITSVNPETGNNIWFYIQALKHSFKLWFVFLPIALWSKSKPLLTFAGTYILFLTLAPINASWYLLPIYPVIAVMMGIALSKIKSRESILLLSVILITGVQLVKWQNQYMVPCTTCHQVEMVKQAKDLMNQDSPLYLDDDYLPVAVFYSESKVVPLRFDRLQRFNDKISLPINSYILSNVETVDNLKNRIDTELETIKSNGDLLLLRTFEK